ncbi:bestrophin family ion channel [Chitinophaga sp.]|uniref:bestrophin family protein n=1 Tax=Chitinophaga sp. TaxID=1869181 RepID=UPI0031E27086
MLLKKNIPFKYVFGKVKYEIALVVLYTLVIVLIHDRFNLQETINIPLTVPMIMGTVISLLLAFRSNQAYDRWWEARTIWGAIVNDSRSFTREVLTFIHSNEFPEEAERMRERMIRRQMAWCYSLGQQLRGLSATEGLERLIPKREVAYVARFANVPMALLELHAKDLQHALQRDWINAYQQVQIDSTLNKFSDSMGKCERIKNTVFPSTYSLYIHFALNFFIMLLPFGVIEFFGWVAVPLVGAIAASFLLIEKMAIHLQDPFDNKPTDTPMTSIARTIERDLRQMLNDNHVPETLPVYSYYVM